MCLKEKIFPSCFSFTFLLSARRHDLSNRIWSLFLKIMLLNKDHLINGWFSPKRLLHFSRNFGWFFYYKGVLILAEIDNPAQGFSGSNFVNRGDWKFCTVLVLDSLSYRWIFCCLLIKTILGYWSMVMLFGSVILEKIRQINAKIARNPCNHDCLRLLLWVWIGTMVSFRYFHGMWLHRAQVLLLLAVVSNGERYSLKTKACLSLIQSKNRPFSS